MDIISTSLYGIIQGLTEFLPVSSSGHLALLPHYLNILDPGVSFDLAMHIGTALAVMLYFHKELRSLLKDGLGLILKKKGPRYFFIINLFISTLTTVMIALVVKDIATTYGRSHYFIAFNLFFFGLLMFIADRKESSKMQVEDFVMVNNLDIKRSLWIGIWQSLALFPGVSRSGATLTISRFLGLSRKESTYYSFLLSLPLIWAGFFYKLPELFRPGTSIDLNTVLIGMGISFFVGLITIHYFFKLIEKIGLSYFAFYRVALALLILTTYY